MTKQQKNKQPVNKPLDIEDNPIFLHLPSGTKQDNGSSAEQSRHDANPVPAPPVKRKLPVEAEPYKFPKGKSGNPNGRPKDVIKEIGKRIARAKVGKTLTPKQAQLAVDLGFNADELTLLEHLMLKLATSANPLKVQLYLERTFGKVANININAEINAQLILRFRSKFTDSELEQVASGADALELLLDKLPDVDEDDSAVLKDGDEYVDAELSE